MTEKSKGKDIKKGCLNLGLITIIIISIFAITCEREPDEPLTKQEIRKNKIKKLVYGFGLYSVNFELMPLIQRSLIDPSYFRIKEISYVDNDSFIVVKNKFTTRNLFREIVTKEVVVKIDTLGRIVDVIKWFDL